MLDQLRAHLAEADLRGGALLVTVNVTNMKAFNAVVGRTMGDRYLTALAERLAHRADACFRVAGDELLAVFHGDPARVRGRLAGLSWMLHVAITATLGWRFGFPDGETSPFVPYRLVEVQVTPRFGYVAMGPEALEDPEPAVAASREHAEAHVEAAFAADWAPLESGPWKGFAPLSRGFVTRTPIQPVTCPRCGVPDLEVEDLDLGVTAERCTVCGSRYERYDRLIVFGREQDAAF